MKVQKKVQVRGISLGLEEEGKGESILFIHGHPFNRTMWHPQLADSDLSNTYRLIAPDLRGFGESDVISGIISFEEIVCDLEALLNKLDIEKVTVCGLSMGGQLALAFYDFFPERVNALVLADTSAPGPNREEFLRREQMAKDILEDQDSFVRGLLPGMVSKQTRESKPEVAEFVLDMMLTAPVKGAAAALRGRARRRDYAPLLSQIDVPTLVVVGTEDAFTPLSDAEFMKNNIQNASLELFEGAAHLPNLETPEQFNAKLKSFLKFATR